MYPIYGIIVLEEEKHLADSSVEEFDVSKIKDVGNGVMGYKAPGGWIVQVPMCVNPQDTKMYLSSACWLLNLLQEEVARTDVNGIMMYDLRKI